MKYTFGEVKEAFDKAPKKIQEIFESQYFLRKIVEIGYDNNLRVDKIGELSNIVIYAILNMFPIEDFVYVIEEELKLTHQQAVKITKEIDQQVFSLIRKIVAGEITFADILKDHLEKEVLGRELTDEDIEVLKRKKKAWVEEFFIDNNQYDTDNPEEIIKKDSLAKVQANTLTNTDTDKPLSFKEKLKKEVEKQKQEEEYIDPYREPID